MTKGVLLDLAGVLYDGEMAIAGSVDAVAQLRAAGIPMRFLTNSTRAPKRVLLARLARLGFEVSENELFTPASAAVAKLRDRDLAPHLLIYPDLAEDFAGLEDLGPEKAVVVGDAGPTFTFETLNAAFRVLDGGADFLALAMNRTFRDADGQRSMDAGAFVAALEYATGRTAEVLGKPAPAFFNAALNDMGITARDAVMIGDDAESDIAGALAAGLGRAILVRTGKYHAGDEGRYEPAASHVVKNLAAAISLIL